MAATIGALKFDQSGERYFETGAKNAVLFVHDGSAYKTGVAWNGITGFTVSPSGAEATALYADDMKYLNLVSAEEYGATVEAYTYPDEFDACQGYASPIAGMKLGQQARSPFGMVVKTTIGNDVNSKLGYKLHILYNALAAPSEKAYTSINDSPEAITFSWELTTTPVEVGTIDGKEYANTAYIELDSRNFTKDGVLDTNFQTLLDYLYGKNGSDGKTPEIDPQLLTPAQIYNVLKNGTLEPAA